MKDQGSTPPQTTSSIAIFTHEKYLDEPKDTELKKKKKTCHKLHEGIQEA